jgi:hypothetical protein
MEREDMKCGGLEESSWRRSIDRRSVSLPDFLVRVARVAPGESEKPGHVDVAVFVQVADKARVEVAQPWEGKPSLLGLLRFGDASPDDLDEVAPVNRIA